MDIEKLIPYNRFIEADSMEKTFFTKRKNAGVEDV